MGRPFERKAQVVSEVQGPPSDPEGVEGTAWVTLELLSPNLPWQGATE